MPAQYLDGGSHTVRFDWWADSTGSEIGSAIVDDATLDCAAAVASPGPSSAGRPIPLRRLR